MAYDLDNMGVAFSPGSYEVESMTIPEGGITSLSSADEMVFDETTSDEYYYVIVPMGEVDLTSVTHQHLIDGGIHTNAVEKAAIVWNGTNYWLCQLGGGSQTMSRTITFSDLD